MSKELRLILPMLEGAGTRTVGPLKFHTGQIGRHSVALLECGIGKVNAAMGATLMAQEFAPELIVNTGVGAGAGPEVSVLDTVIATGVAMHDFWCIGEDWGHVPGSPLIFPAEKMSGIVEGEQVKRGLIASGDMFITSREQVDGIREHFPTVIAVDMESAAIAQVCSHFKIPFFCMRVISDSPWCSHDNSSQYESFWEDAPRRSFNLVRNILEKL